MDRSPGRRTLAPNGAWEVVVAEGGALAYRRAGRFGEEVALDVGVDPRVAFVGDTVYYARRGEWAETDLWRVTLPDGEPTLVTGWAGSEDRPAVSPDGRRLAFVSGRTGIASWWVVELDALPIPPEMGRQVTNVGVTRGQPGQPPAGWVPVPDGTTYAWTDAGLTWVAEGAAFAVSPK
jgi:TolB protein